MRKEGLAKAKNDDKAVALIEKDFKLKMENDGLKEKMKVGWYECIPCEELI